MNQICLQSECSNKHRPSSHCDTCVNRSASVTVDLMADFDSKSDVLGSIFFPSRLAKKLEHSWKALVHDGVRRSLPSVVFECGNLIRHLKTCPILSLLSRTPCRCTDLVSTQNDLKSSCAMSPSGKPRVSVQCETLDTIIICGPIFQSKQTFSFLFCH